MPKFLWEDIALYVAPVFRAPAIPGLAHSKVSQRGRPQSLAQSIPPAWDRTFALRQCSRLPCSGRSSTQPSPNSAGLNSAEVSTQQVPSQQSLDSAKSQLSKSHLSNAQLKPLQVYIALRGSGPSPHIFKKKLLAEGQCVKNPGEELAPSSLVSPIKFSQPLQVYIALRGSGPSPHILKKKSCWPKASA